MPNDKNIIKLQNAGTMPSVNEYGLTEEEMASVRNNAQRYKISEEDAIAAKIKAKEETRSFRNETMGSLGGLMGAVYQDQAYNDIKNKLKLHAFTSNFNNFKTPKLEIQSSFSWPTAKENLEKSFIRSLSDFDPYWKIKMSRKINDGFTLNNVKEQSDLKPIEKVFNEEQVPVQRSTTSVNIPMHELKARERAKANAIREHEEAVETYRKYPRVKTPEWFSLLQQTAPDNHYSNVLLNKMYTDYGEKLYNEKYNEYLTQHPIQPGTGTGYDQYMGIQYNPLVKRQQAAHDYAVKESGYIGDKSTDPYKEVDDTMAKVSIMGASMIPLFGASAGALGTIPKLLTDSYFGYEGVKGLLSSEGIAKTHNFIKQGRYGRAAWSGVGDLFNLALARQGVRGLKGLDKYAKDVADVAKFNIWNRANKFRMEYPWQRKELLPQVLKRPFEFNSPLWTTDNLLNASTYRMLPPTYKTGGYLKLQEGGSVYKPFIPEKERIIREATPAVFDDEDSYSYTPEPEEDYDLEVEPVLVYRPLTDKRQRVLLPEEYVQSTPVQVDNTRVASSNQGKVYTSSEKETFKTELYNAYDNALKRLGLSEEKASAFAKRFTAQDILESNWGQSSLSKYFNFGGIKDFSGTGVQKDTTEFVNGVRTTMKQGFRQFSSMDDYVNYKINLVQRKWNVLNADPKKFFSLIVSGKQKYATDPNYTSKLENLYKQIWKE